METMQHNDFVLDRPAQWFDVSTVVLVGPAVGDFSPNITVTREPLASPTTVEDYAARQLTQLNDALGGQQYRVLQEGKTALGDRPAYQRFHTFVMPDGGPQIKQWQVYVIGERDAVTLTATDTAANFDRSFPVFQQAINGFRFVTGKPAAGA